MKECVYIVITFILVVGAFRLGQLGIWQQAVSLGYAVYKDNDFFWRAQ